MTTPTAVQPPCLDLFQSLDTLPLVERYRTASHRLDRRALELSAEHLHRTFSESDGVGGWSVQTLLGHLADTELAYTFRIRRTIAEDGPQLTPFDEHAFIDAGLYQPSAHGIAGPAPGGIEGGKPVAGFVAVIHTLRLWNGQYLATLTQDQFDRQALHPQYGPMTVRNMLDSITWHLEHHAAFLTAKLDLMLGPIDPNATPSKACGPGCGCHPNG